MASTNKTKYLRLNQWAETDPVLCGDFNADNSLLDTAIHNRALERITTKTITSATNTISFSLADYDFSVYAQLEILLMPITSTTSVSGGAMTTLTANGSTSGVSLARMSSDGTRGLIVHLMALPGGMGGFYFAPGGTASGGFLLPGSVKAASLRSLELRCGDSATYNSGTVCTLYGIRHN